ncbi:MAG: Unknown protein [uncultured Sulfurovum sp.]|uniref:UPF0323 domain-containing protein n=1 Tax=uncultured Sulfurovum sp. TaxID=269237 RepID=A0A6S6UBB0_9BACT|nr:MAG: Unknown protein [uncultured Sulfurovum sp.]
MNKQIKKVSNYAIAGGMSAFVIATLAGCGDAPKEEEKPKDPTLAESVEKEGASITIEEGADKSYKIVDEFPSSKTRVILRDENGTERILSDEELEKLIKDEEAKIEAGTSDLTKSPEEVASGGGMGLAGTLLAGAAAGMLGAALMNKLQNNQNYNQNRRSSYKSPQAYSRSNSSFGNRKPGGMSRPSGATASKSTSSSTKQSGFGKSSTPASSSSSSSRSSGFGG